MADNRMSAGAAPQSAVDAVYWFADRAAAATPAFTGR
jgi:hypothetical protein